MIFKIVQYLHVTVCMAMYSTVNEGIRHGIYMKDYCPKMKSCPEGTHVLCMHNPDIKNGMGPYCHDAQNVTITNSLADTIVSIVNAMRKNIALGNEKGKNNEPLPKGYGMMKLEWDEDLATFAQVLANQCGLRHDLCRATKRFDDPGQNIGVIRFSYPDWKNIRSSLRVQPVFSTTERKPEGFGSYLIEYAIKMIMKKWYQYKNFLTASMVEKYLDIPNGGDLYLKMVYGSASHLGCGISAYTDYMYNNENTDLIYNIIQMVCNISAQPKYGMPVYNVTLPSDQSSSHCGCTSSAHDDEGCLCKLKDDHYKPAYKGITKTKDNQNKKCESCRKENPPYLLLPIFTVEDGYPPNTRKLASNVQTDIETRNIQPIARFHPEAKPVQARKVYAKTATDTKKVEIIKKRLNKPLRAKTSPNGELFAQVSKPNGVRDARNRDGPSSYPERFSFSNRDYKPQSIDLDSMSKRDFDNNMIDNSNEESDKKLMSLLDHLEQEVRRINLNTEERGVIDAKIRKIYGNLGLGRRRHTQSAHYESPEDRYSERLNQRTENIKTNHITSKRKTHIPKEIVSPRFVVRPLKKYNDGTNSLRKRIDTADHDEDMSVQKRNYYQEKVKSIESTANKSNDPKINKRRGATNNYENRVRRPVRPTNGLMAYPSSLRPTPPDDYIYVPVRPRIDDNEAG